MNAEKLRELTDQELLAMVGDIDAELYRLRNERIARGKTGDVALPRKRRRDKARILTVLGERRDTKEGVA